MTFHFIYYAGVAMYTYGCGEKRKWEPEGCKTGTFSVKCYCTGTKCKVPNPTEKKIIQCRTGAGVSAGKHDANASIRYKDCKEGVTQCKLSGKKAFGKFIFFGIIFVKTTYVFATKT